MGGVFSKKGVTSKVVPGDAPRTQSAPAGLGRCSPVLGVDATHGIITTRPASAEEPSGCLSDRPGSSDTAVFSDRRLRSVGGGRPIVDAAAVAALRPFEKHGNDGKTPSGVVPEGSDPGRVLEADMSPAMSGPPKHAPVGEWSRVFGADNVDLIYSSVWAERERGLRNVHSLLVAGSVGGSDDDHADVTVRRGRKSRCAAESWRHVCDVLQTLARDKVAPVFFTALEVLDAAATSLARCAGAEAVHDGLDKVLPTLVSRAGNRNGRISAASIEAVVSLARHPAVGILYVLDHVFSSVDAPSSASTRAGGKGEKRSGQPRAAGAGKGATVTVLTGRLELLTKFVEHDMVRRGSQTGGRGREGVSLERMIGFLVPALETPDDRVRSLAIGLLTRLYKKHGEGSGEGEALSDIIASYATRLSPAMQKMLMRKLNAAGEEASMDAAIENGDLEALLTPKKSSLSLPSLPPLSVSGRSALPPLSERKVLAAQNNHAVGGEGVSGFNASPAGFHSSFRKRSAPSPKPSPPASSGLSSLNFVLPSTPGIDDRTGDNLFSGKPRGEYDPNADAVLMDSGSSKSLRVGYNSSRKLFAAGDMMSEAF